MPKAEMKELKRQHAMGKKPECNACVNQTWPTSRAMWRIKTAILVALLGPFQYGQHDSVFLYLTLKTGIALVVVNTMLDRLSEDLGFDKNVGGAVASAALYLGAGVGGLLSGLFQRICGKFSQVLIGIMYAAGSVMCGLSTDDKICWGGPFDGCVAYMVVAGRTLTGIASGLMLVISPKSISFVLFGFSHLGLDIWPMCRHRQ